jgi:hypothetical protein
VWKHSQFIFKEGVMAESEKERTCLDNARLFEPLIPFAVMFEEEDGDPPPLPRRRSCKVKYDYDYRVVVAQAQEKGHANFLHR